MDCMTLIIRRPLQKKHVVTTPPKIVVYMGKSPKMTSLKLKEVGTVYRHIVYIDMFPWVHPALFGCVSFFPSTEWFMTFPTCCWWVGFCIMRPRWVSKKEYLHWLGPQPRCNIGSWSKSSIQLNPIDGWCFRIFEWLEAERWWSWRWPSWWEWWRWWWWWRWWCSTSESVAPKIDILEALPPFALHVASFVHYHGSILADFRN